MFYYEVVAYGRTAGSSNDGGDGSAVSGGRTSIRASNPIVVCQFCSSGYITGTNLSPRPLRTRCGTAFTWTLLAHYWVTSAYSRRLGIIRMSKYPTMEKITTAFNILFTMCGSPKTIVSDNGPQFGSKQFEDWCHLNVIIIHTLNKCPISPAL